MNATLGQSIASAAAALVVLTGLVTTPAWLAGRKTTRPAEETPALELGSGRARRAPASDSLTVPGLSLARDEPPAATITVPAASAAQAPAPGAFGTPAAQAAADAGPAAPAAAGPPSTASLVPLLTAPAAAPGAPGGASEAARVANEVLVRLAQAHPLGQLPGPSLRPGAGDHTGGRPGGRSRNGANGNSDDGEDTGGHDAARRAGGGTRQPQPRWPDPETLSRLFGDGTPGR